MSTCCPRKNWRSRRSLRSHRHPSSLPYLPGEWRLRARGVTRSECMRTATGRSTRTSRRCVSLDFLWDEPAMRCHRVSHRRSKSIETSGASRNWGVRTRRTSHLNGTAHCASNCALPHSHLNGTALCVEVRKAQFAVKYAVSSAVQVRSATSAQPFRCEWDECAGLAVPLFRQPLPFLISPSSDAGMISGKQHLRER